MGPLIPPLVWAQAGSGAGAPNPLVLLVPRRWSSSLSLSSPNPVPGLHPLWGFLAALGILLLLSVVFQGPGRALRQVFDVPGLARLCVQSASRLRRSSRIVATLLGFMVLSWTAAQAMTYRHDQGKDDLVLLQKTRSFGELGFEQGLHCALTPFRDVASLGDNLPLLMVATFFLFRAMSNPWEQIIHQGAGGGRLKAFDGSARSRSNRMFLICGCASLYILYRIVGWALPYTGLPIGGCLVLEVILIPTVMLLCDGFLLAWVLADLRDSEFTAGEERERIGSVSRAVDMTPAAMLVCAAILPARYVATFVLLLMLGHLPPWIAATAIGRYLRWQLGPGLADVQAAGLVLAGVLGVAVWSRGTLRGIPRGWSRLLSAEGGHLVAALAMIGIMAGVFSAIPYFILLLLPVQTWVLAAADSYSHYATLPVALWGSASLIEIGRTALPVAHFATIDPPVQEPLEDSVATAAS